jgi:hypothetical protein
MTRRNQQIHSDLPHPDFDKTQTLRGIDHQ